MKRILALLLALLTLLCSCAPAGGETETVDPGEMTTETETETETEAETKAERVRFSIPVKEDAYVMNKNDKGDQKDANFGSDKEIHLKTNGGSLTRYGYLKFDISDLVGDDEFTAIELELTLTVRQTDPGSEFAVVEVYGADNAWDEAELTFNKQPETFNLITTNSTITSQPVASRFSITDYVRKALANGQTEISLYLKEAAPVALHTRFASKEAGTGAPKLSVYYGQKTDDSVYTGLTAAKGPEMSKTGIDTILGWDTVEKLTIPVFEDTYVEAGSSGDKNFGSADIIDFKAMASSPNNYYRIPLLKFDLNDLKAEGISAASLVMTCSSIEQDNTPRVINIYSCDPYEWEENTVTYNTLCEKEELVTSFTWSGGKGTYPIDITKYIQQVAAAGDRYIAFYMEGESTSMYRTTFDSSEKSGGRGPYLEVTYGSASFATKINYTGENPWDVAMTAVKTWLARWEDIKKHGTNDAETIKKDMFEYTMSVDAATAGKTNGASTSYTPYKTRNISTLKNYTPITDEVAKYDKYGGYMGGEKYEATGFFYTKKIGDRWWTIDPLGYPFYRVACVQISHGSSPAQKKTTLAKLGSVAAWAKSATDRMWELGFNSAGGWSEIASLSQVDNPIAQTAILNIATTYGSEIGIPINAGGAAMAVADVIPSFDPYFAEYAEKRIRTVVTPYIDSPDVYGWMSDNEISQNFKMLDHALMLDYNNIRYVYSYATAWTFLYLKTGKANLSIGDVTDELRKEFRAMVYDKYFEVVTTALKKVDPNHLYLGCRFVNNNYKDEYVMRVAGYWCDIVTFNYYNVWEGDPTLLTNIQNWMNAPFAVTEWYAKGMDVWEKDNRIVNKTGAGWTVRTQDDRGKFYQNYALMLMECRGCVGFDWFKYWDNDPTDTGADPSNRDSNKGIYSNAFEEYTDLTEYMKELNTQKYNLIEFFDER